MEIDVSEDFANGRTQAEHEAHMKRGDIQNDISEIQALLDAHDGKIDRHCRMFELAHSGEDGAEEYAKELPRCANELAVCISTVSRIMAENGVSGHELFDYSAESAPSDILAPANSELSGDAEAKANYISSHISALYFKVKAAEGVTELQALLDAL